jgi:hypothetical protein
MGTSNYMLVVHMCACQPHGTGRPALRTAHPSRPVGLVPSRVASSRTLLGASMGAGPGARLRDSPAHTDWPGPIAARCSDTPVFPTDERLVAPLTSLARRLGVAAIEGLATNLAVLP